MKKLAFALLAASLAVVCSCDWRGLSAVGGAEKEAAIVGGAQNRAAAGGYGSRLEIIAPLEKQLSPELAERDADVCGLWTYRTENLASDLMAMRKSDVGEWGRSCYQYACSSVGRVRLDGELYRVEVNAGGWILLRGGEGSNVQYFISDNLRPGYMATCDCCE